MENVSVRKENSFKKEHAKTGIFQVQKDVKTEHGARTSITKSLRPLTHESFLLSQK